MELWEKLKRAFDSHPVVLVAVVFTILLSAATLVGHIEGAKSIFDQFVQVATTTNKPNVTVVAKFWFFFICAVLILLVTAFLALYIQSERGRRQAIKSRNERSTVAFKTLLGMMRAAAKIKELHHPASNRIIKSCKSMRITVLLNKNLDAEVRQEYEFFTTEEPVRFWAITMRANSSAEPRDYLLDMNFKVTDESGRDVVYLPTENDLRTKAVVLYFLPQIEPGEDTPRKIIVSYTWPGMARQIKDLGEEVFEFAMESKTPVELVELAFFLESGAGGNLICEHSGPNYSGAKPQATTHVERRWPGYIYRVDNGPAGRSRYAVNVRLREP
jgi:hypothetical protein